MSADSDSAPSDKRKKTTEVNDLPDAPVNEGDAADVKGGATSVPCIKQGIPCVRHVDPCFRPGGLPPGPYKPGGH